MADSPGTLAERLNAAVAALDRSRLQDRFAGLGLVPIADAAERRPVRLGGEVRSTRVAAFGERPSLDVHITDGTGTVIARFTGRRRIPGLDAGRGVLLEGVGRRRQGRLEILNPAYTLLP